MHTLKEINTVNLTFLLRKSVPQNKLIITSTFLRETYVREFIFSKTAGSYLFYFME